MILLAGLTFLGMHIADCCMVRKLKRNLVQWYVSACELTAYLLHLCVARVMVQERERYASGTGGTRHRT